ncbi:hypothetical protein [uncultured Roseibium sp.]|uniref:hypothetical protein n=1 Tax=uncultured Roseibium sp. TaxID=1936171 RepID=UPI002617685F|nr:hypothetical protein [uncultured Roseibium sp.]
MTPRSDVDIASKLLFARTRFKPRVDIDLWNNEFGASCREVPQADSLIHIDAFLSSPLAGETFDSDERESLRVPPVYNINSREDTV